MRNMIRIPVLFGVVILALTACSILQEPEEASAPIEAIPLEVESEPAEAATEAEALPAEAEVEETAYPAPGEDVQEAVDDEAYPAPEGESAPSEPRIYVISQADSQVRFVLDEELRGQPTTVTGVTDQVAGEIALDLNDLAATQVGVLQINARTLATDNNFRNRAIQNQILDTGTYEFITFSPTSIQGLPASAVIGEEIDFTVAGDLTIRDVTESVLFFVSATAVSEDQLVGVANGSVFRSDYGLEIPSVPNVANVEEEVELYIDFVANAK